MTNPINDESNDMYDDALYCKLGGVCNIQPIFFLKPLYKMPYSVANLKKYNVGPLMTSNVRDDYPAPQFFALPGDNSVAGEYISGLVYKWNNGAVGYPDQPVGKWHHPGSEPKVNSAKGGRRNTRRRNTRRRNMSRRSQRR